VFTCRYIRQSLTCKPMGEKNKKISYRKFRLLAIFLLKEYKLDKKYINRIFNRIEIDPVTRCWNSTYASNSWGYAKISIKSKVLAVHRIMYEYIHGTIPSDKPFILHRCDNPKCCNPTHLYSGTPQNNVDDMINRNRYPDQKGETNYGAKLTEKQVKEIRASNKPQPILAKQFNVVRQTISNIKTRRRWKHLP